MIRDITLGQYYHGDSVVHNLDPRTKLIGTILYIISLFLVNNIFGYIFTAIFLGVVIKTTKVPFKFIIKGLRAIIVILLITVAFNLFLTPGEELVTFWIFKITKQGVKVSVFMALRLIFLILGCSLMTLTTTPNNLTDGMEKLLKPLSAIKVPVHEVAMMMSIALRFIPILLEETDKIMKAQMARGADFETGNIIKKIKSMVPIMVPLFVAAFRRANDLAMAMEARCYQGGEGRTKMKPLVYKRNDKIAYGILIGYIVVTILIGTYLNIGI